MADIQSWINARIRLWRRVAEGAAGSPCNPCRRFGGLPGSQQGRSSCGAALPAP